jgi:hypothetical protein
VLVTTFGVLIRVLAGKSFAAWADRPFEENTMGSSGKAFDEVKAILGKLDRSIDQARHKRLGPDELETSENHSDADSGLIGRGEPSPDTVVGRADAPKAPSAPVPNQAPARARSASEYGRARPLRRDNDANPTGQWDKKAAKIEIDDDTSIG